MNFDNMGVPVAKVINVKNKKDRVLYVNDEEDDSNFDRYVCKNNEVIQQIPNKDSERFVAYITGMSGSGKSYYAKNLAMEYNKIHKKRTVYLFSMIQDNDKSLEGIKNLKRVQLNEEFLNYEYEAEDFKNCLCIFDDTDCIIDKAFKHKIKQILMMILQTGRHNETSIIYCSHIACNGPDTKIILNECHSITLFLKTMQGKAIKYLLENYMSMDKKQINELKKINSRWISICKTYPNVILSHKEAYVLKN